MKQYWILGSDHQPIGPLAEEDLKRKFSEGTLPKDAMACVVGEQVWVPVAEVVKYLVDGDASSFRPPPPPPPASRRTGSVSPSAGASIGGINELAELLTGRIAQATQTDKVNYAEVHTLFSSLFRRHSSDEAEAHFGVGLASTTPSLAEMKDCKPQPWFFGRVMLFLGVAFLALSYSWEQFENINLLPGLIFTGSFAAPLAMAIFFFECNQPKNVSLYVVLKLFVWGGIMGIVLSLFLFEVDWPTAVFGASAAALIEEPGKLAAVILLAHRARYPWTLNGLCFGAAVGAGFAAFESAGYALRVAMRAGSDAMTENLVVRGFLSPFGHVIWTAVAAGALWRVTKGGPLTKDSFRNWRFVSPFLAMVALHFVWNSNFLDGLPFFGKPLLLGLIAWVVGLGLLFGGFREASKGELPTPMK